MSSHRARHRSCESHCAWDASSDRRPTTDHHCGVPRHNSIRAEVERSAHGVVHRPLSFVGRERQSASAPSPTSSTDSIAAPLLILGWVLSSPLRGYSARAETLASLAVHRAIHGLQGKWLAQGKMEIGPAQFLEIILILLSPMRHDYKYGGFALQGQKHHPGMGMLQLPIPAACALRHN